MKKQEKAVIKEVLDAMNTHVAIIRNNAKLNARIDKDTMEDIETGMSISIDKLKSLIKNKKSY